MANYFQNEIFIKIKNKNKENLISLFFNNWYKK